MQTSSQWDLLLSCSHGMSKNKVQAQAGKKLHVGSPSPMGAVSQVARRAGENAGDTSSTLFYGQC